MSIYDIKTVVAMLLELNSNKILNAAKNRSNIKKMKTNK
jgi:hypothetical protein